MSPVAPGLHSLSHETLYREISLMWVSKLWDMRLEIWILLWNLTGVSVNVLFRHLCITIAMGCPFLSYRYSRNTAPTSPHVRSCSYINSTIIIDMFFVVQWYWTVLWVYMYVRYDGRAVVKSLTFHRLCLHGLYENITARRQHVTASCAGICLTWERKKRESSGVENLKR